MDGSFPEHTSIADLHTRESLLAKLLAHGVVTKKDSQTLEKLFDKNNEPLDQLVCTLGMATEESIADAYSTIFELVRFIEPASLTNQESAILFGAQLNSEFLRKNRIVPIAVTDETVLAVMVDPSNRMAIEGINFALRKPVQIQVATASQFDRIIGQICTDHDNDEHSPELGNVEGDIDQLKDMASSEPVVRYVNRLISEAVRKNTSDIHVEPDERETHIRWRIDGALRSFETIGPAQGLSIISRLKILADLDIAEQRRPQDGRMSFTVGGRKVDLRLSTTPTVNGESLVIRLLDQSRAPLDLEGLGFDEPSCDQLRQWIAAPNGIILLTGPTGSGKTTTLYALLRLLATGERKILTIEDPVEYKLPASINHK